jgi:hypothetical protein
MTTDWMMALFGSQNSSAICPWTAPNALARKLQGRFGTTVSVI